MRMAPLIGIEVAAFLLIIAEAYAFFMFVVPLGPLPHNLLAYTGYTLLKMVLTLGLGALWLVVMVFLTDVYVRSRSGGPTPTPSS